MRYLIVQDWASTHGNHAGMLHMCNLLLKKFPNDYRVLVLDCPLTFWDKKGLRKVSNLIRCIYEKWIYPTMVVHRCKDIINKLNDNDEVFLLEYLYPETSQLKLAKTIKKKNPLIKLYGLTHLTPTYAENKYSSYKNMILKWGEPIDMYLTLGTSLSSYLMSSGVGRNKISTGFHYVDGDYYCPSFRLRPKNNRLTIIVIGAMARNFELLSEIVNASTEVNWIICKGNKNINHLFEKSKNVQLLGYLAENELKNKMEQSDISLSVMDDTIGSNVITTSLSMGLAQIVSDVGSIRDYCSDANTIFCKNNKESFIAAIKRLANNIDLVSEMQKNAIIESQRFKIENVHKWFNSLL